VGDGVLVRSPKVKVADVLTDSLAVMVWMVPDSVPKAEPVPVMKKVASGVM
jgi:hypothetical protein